MNETINPIENGMPETITNEKKYTIDENGHRKYEMTCEACDSSFTRSIPDHWFNGNDKIKEHNLPEGFKIEDIQRILDNPNCGACDPKMKAILKKIGILNLN